MKEDFKVKQYRIKIEVLKKLFKPKNKKCESSFPFLVENLLNVQYYIQETDNLKLSFFIYFIFDGFLETILADIINLEEEEEEDREEEFIRKDGFCSISYYDDWYFFKPDYIKNAFLELQKHNILQFDEKNSKINDEHDYEFWYKLDLRSIANICFGEFADFLSIENNSYENYKKLFLS